MTVIRISKIQKQFWILNEIYPNSGAYNLYSVFKLSEPLNYEYLQRAVSTVISRHEPLRTSFELIDNELCQVIKTAEETALPITEVNIEEIFNETEIHPDIIYEANRSFDLSSSPLCRITVFSFRNQISVLSIVFHHIIIDVRSEGIFAKELSEVYNSLVEKREMRLEAVRFQYSDYIDEISSWYTSEKYLEKLKELERDSPDPNTFIKLPEDRINDGAVSNDASGFYFSIEKQFSDKIKQFADKNNINPYRVFLAAYAVLLYRLSNQEKISIGLPLTNRTRPVSKSTFGCFINALPLLVDFSDDKSSKDVLENVSGSLTRLLDRQEVPFTDLVIHSRHESTTTVNPYFQTGFAFKPPMQLEIDNIEARPLKIIHRENQNEFDLLLTLYPEGEGFTGYARYTAQLFRGETVNKWIELYKKIVNQLIDYPESSVNKIDVLSDDDKKRLNEFNSTEAAIPECLVQNFFEQQAAGRPEKTAVISGGISHSYRELEERSNQLANYLWSLGVKQGDIVGVCMERSFEMVVSVLGVLKAGCCYLPMDPSFPDERISYMYEDSGAKVLISQSSLRDKLGHFTGATIVLTDLDRDRIGGSSTEKPEIIIDNQSLAYIIYTSGSTGKPKGVKVPHEGVVNLIGSMTKAPGIKAEDILLAVVTLSFDMSVYELFVPLSSGATVVVATSRDTTDGQALIGLLDKYNITMLQATPSLWNILLASGWKGKRDLRGFCGGEALTKNLVRQVLPKVSEFWNCYGPTETTVYSAIVKVTDAEAPIVIGKPIDNTRIYILDKNVNQVPVGVTGEVCIGGRGVTKGYNNLPELTSEKFIRIEGGDVIYKTGDLGRYLSDGTIELFGRSDNQIKLRGFRIEPGEIESLLSQLPGVREAVVKIHRFDENDQRLVAFLNVSGEFSMTREEMTESLSHRLPGYMIPSFLQTSDGFPRLPNGKISKKALILEVDEPEKKTEVSFDSLTTTQKRILNIWQEILKVKNISASVNFFDAGGNSLLVIRMLNKIREDVGYTMSFKEFMAHPTVVQSGSYIDSQSQVVSEGGIDLVHQTGTTNLPPALDQKRISAGLDHGNESIEFLKEDLQGSFLEISDKERELIDLVNNTVTDYSREKTILRLFEEWALADPEKTALISDSGMLTYSEVNAKATQLAAILQKHNIGAGDFVGLLLRRSPELIICLLAIFKCGAAYVPLNLSDPDNRVISIIDTAKIKCVITNNDNNINLAGRCHQHNIEDLIEQSARSGVKYIDIITKSSDHAYVIFTSGTTGTPKGVLVNHKSVVNLIEWVNRTFEVTCSDKLLWVTNLSFDLSVYDIFGTLAAGAIVRIISEEDRQDPEKQFNILLNEGITFWDSTPQCLQQLTHFFKSNGDNSFKNSLRLVFLSGDWIPLSLPATINSAFPSAVVVGLGGATEATIWSNYFIIDKINPDWKSIPYGKPIQNSRYYILDGKLNYCRIKQPGSLYIGGDCLALGYINDSVLTDSRFIPDPYNPGSKIYMTGDKAQWMPDGNIEFLGREDEQLKVRGYRVETGEIKNVFLQNKKIKDATVIADKSDRHNIKVILFFTTFDDIKLEVKDLKKEMRESLPEYMIPADIIQCSEFPVTANGKTDTKALLYYYIKSVNENQKKNSEGFLDSKLSQLTVTGRIINRIWCEALLKKEISATDNFFDIGGNSILAIRVLNGIKEKLGFTIPFKTFIDNPTIIESANNIENQSGIKKEAIKLEHLTGTTNLPITLNQKRIWLISKFQPDIPSYIIPFTFKLSGALDRDIFQKSLGMLFHRHHIIYSRIKEVEGEPCCDIVESDPYISYTDYSGLPETERSEKVRDIFKADSEEVFNLENGPLYRLYLIRTGTEEYYFRISIHHIVFDGWSWGVLVTDLNEIYNSLVRGKEAVLENIEFQQYDYARWENSPAGLIHGNESIEFWKENLQGATSVLNFPYDYQRSDKLTGRAGYETLSLSEDLSEKLRRIGRGEGSTLFATMLSAFGVQLQKYTGEDDLNIGLPVAYRPHSKLENIIGMFVNTVVVRLRYEKGDTFKDIIHRTSELAFNAIAHQDLAFEKVVEIVNPERTTNINPLFQVGFDWQNNLWDAIKLDKVISESITSPERTTIFDITLYVWEENNHIEGELEYNTDILKQDTVVRMRDNFITLLQSLTENPDRVLSEITLLSETEKKLLSEFNNTTVPVADCLIQNFFEKQAAGRPEKTAVISGGISHSYRELEERSNQLANYLWSLGVKQGDIVGICLERSFEMVVSVLGVLKAGCCYLPMDPSFPDERISYMYEDSGAKVLISQSSLRDKLGHFTGATIVLTDLDRDRIGGSSTERPEIVIDNQSLAYIIYTSGSTGKPKGVKVPHEGVVNLIGSMTKAPGVKAEDILLAVVTLSFDMSVYELFVPLSSGATVVVATSRDTTDGQALIGLMDKYNITMLQATPSLWNILLASGWQGKKDLRGFCGGEALTKNLVRQVLPKVSEFWNCYGPTETTVYSAIVKVTDAEAPIVIGKAIDNTRIYILDKNGNQVPVGVTGEVCIGGRGVTKGYNNLPELTSEKFIRIEGGDLIYKTGDLGRYLADGTIELFGRSDNQIKLRGFRIEPGEIESLLSQLPGVREAVVKIHRFDENDQRLVAFLNVSGEFSMTREEMTESLSHRLPGYMIPSFFQTSDGFPRLPNGKINKKALILEVDEPEKKTEVSFDSLTTTQKRILNIWQEILKIKNISASVNFFDAGGNSLLVIRMLNKIREDIGYTMSFKEFMAHPTVVQSGSYIDSQSQVVSEGGIDLVHQTGTTNLPLTLNQKRIWLISKLQPDIPSYIISYSYKFSGSLDRDIFKKSLDILFNRHLIIFSVINDVNSEPYCDIVKSKIEIPFFDYSEVAEKERLAKVNDIFDADSGKVFDLEHGPLYRLYLIRTAEEEYYFRISIHHIIFDGWSWGVLVNDLNEIYNSLVGGREAVLENIDFQQYDYAEWESSPAGLDHGNDSKAFWKENLQGATPVLNFPYDYQRSDKPTGRAGYETISLSEDLSEKLRRISKAEDSTLFATMLSAFAIQLQKYTGEDDLNIGLPIAYRPHSKLENIIGMFVNTVVVRLRYEAGNTFKDIIHRTGEAALNAIAHQDLPFEKVVEIVNPERSSYANPLFQVAFAWQNNLEEPITLDGIRSVRINGGDRTSIFDIIFYMYENGKQIEGELEYNSDILRHETIVRMRDNFLNLINNLVDNTETSIGSLSMISDDEKKEIDGFNNTKTDYPKDKTIMKLFEDQVNLYPDKTAVAFKDEFLTYNQLNERANQLARKLRKSGVSANTTIGILAEKSVDLVLGILGILKSGGAYVPIDPEYPQQRLNFIIRDSGCRILLTQDKFINIPVDGVTRINLDSLVFYDNDESNVDIINDPADLAYIMYTSGTTGLPKGSMISQKGVVRLVRNTNYIEMTSDDRILLTGAIVFDATTFEIWGALLNGGTLFIAEKETILNPKALGEELVKNDITILWLTSALFTQIAEARTDIFRKLKYLLSGGDVLSAAHINKVRKDNPYLKVINGYGPTENTTFSTTYEIDKDFTNNIPIGKPISNSTAYIFDKNMNYQPIGVIGELYVGGDGVSLGYINREDLDRMSFKDHPYIPGERLYKTGDYARWLPDGNIEFHGRMDNQLKIRGFRVELGEIESVISEINGVIETVIKPIKVGEGDTRLIAFLNVSDSFSLDAREIRNLMKEKLPPYMIPSAFKLMNGFPTTINGKIDKDALKIDINELVNREIRDVNSFTPTEKKIYEIWCEALKTNDISPADNFFEVGGNSLLAISVFSKIESAFNIDLGLRVFFDSPRIDAMAEAIDLSMLKIVGQKSITKSKGEESRIIEGEI